MDHTHADAHAHPTGNRQYFVTWGWLLVMTMLALGLGYAPVPEGLKALLLVGVTLAKIVLIASIFMHLRFEKLNLVLLTFSPLVLALILFFITFGESGGSSTHIIQTHGAAGAQQESKTAH
jgi:caa(3)-type oxidase subunit IV